jgi:hypothetical protein
MSAIVEYEIAEGDRVTHRLTVSGTQVALFCRLNAIGAGVAWRAFAIVRAGQDRPWSTFGCAGIGSAAPLDANGRHEYRTHAQIERPIRADGTLLRTAVERSPTPAARGRRAHPQSFGDSDIARTVPTCRTAPAHCAPEREYGRQPSMDHR